MTAQIYTDSPNSQLVVQFEFPESLRDMDKKIRKKLPGLLRRIANEGKSFWKTLAGQKLKSSRLEYVRNIKMEVVDDLSFYIKLEGFVPYSVEYGRGAFDMKPGFLKNGKYKIVPLNVNRYINMQVPTVFRTVSVNSPPASWMHPGWKGMKLSEEVVRELDTRIIPDAVDKFFQDLDKP